MFKLALLLLLLLYYFFFTITALKKSGIAAIFLVRFCVLSQTSCYYCVIARMHQSGGKYVILKKNEKKKIEQNDTLKNMEVSLFSGNSRHKYFIVVSVRCSRWRR